MYVLQSTDRVFRGSEQFKTSHLKARQYSTQFSSPRMFKHCVVFNETSAFSRGFKKSDCAFPRPDRLLPELLSARRGRC